jgi:hypothetical protein
MKKLLTYAVALLGGFLLVRIIEYWLHPAHPR